MPDMDSPFISGMIARMLNPDVPDLSPEVARYFLKVSFTEQDRQRIDELSEKAREGTLTQSEDSELDMLVVFSHLISALQSKARISLKTSTSAA
jgi:hypothetical protein